MTLPRLPLIAIVLALSAAGCSGGDKSDAGTFDVGTPTGAASAGAPPTVAAGKLKAPPPARMFAGTRSVTGQLTRYCKSSCVVSSPTAPDYLNAPTGAFVVFTLGETPQTAVAEIRATASEDPGTVTLNPSTLMVFDHGLGQGRYLVDLLVRWKSSEARWRFGLKVT
ncbi:MAG: hypothetical protein ACRDJ1_11160 [Actinomycetota bacterium]